jgi:hypothetical protein
MLRFWLERGGGETKLYQKMKRMQRARLGSMERKRDMVRQRGDVGRRRDNTGGGEREGMTLVGLMRILLIRKI